MNINILNNNIKTVEFENIEVYQTIPHKNLKTNLNMILNQIKNQIGVIFFSPSGFHAILELIPKQLISQIFVSIHTIYVCVLLLIHWSILILTNNILYIFYQI